MNAWNCYHLLQLDCSSVKHRACTSIFAVARLASFRVLFLFVVSFITELRIELKIIFLLSQIIVHTFRVEGQRNNPIWPIKGGPYALYGPAIDSWGNLFNPQNKNHTKLWSYPNFQMSSAKCICGLHFRPIVPKMDCFCCPRPWILTPWYSANHQPPQWRHQNTQP